MLACSTIKVGKECIFMKKSGCAYKGAKCYPIIENCEGCSNIETINNVKYCNIFAEPSIKWNVERCNMSTHVAVEDKSAAPAKKVNPLKASKRSKRK